MVRVPPPPPGTVDVTSFHMVAARESKWSGGEVGRCCNSVVKTSMPRQRERESFHRFLIFLSLLFSPSSPQAVISKRIQNAKSEKFFGNIHKRGLVQNTTQVRERKRKRERGREKSGAISEEAEFEKKKRKNATRLSSALTSTFLPLPPTTTTPLLNRRKRARAPTSGPSCSASSSSSSSGRRCCRSFARPRAGHRFDFFEFFWLKPKQVERKQSSSSFSSYFF